MRCQLSISNVRFCFFTFSRLRPSALYHPSTHISQDLVPQSHCVFFLVRALSHPENIGHRSSPFIGHPSPVVYISYRQQVEDHGTTKWQPRFPAVRHYTLSMVPHSLATILYVELTACPIQRNNRYSSQEAQAASLLGVGSQFDNPKTSSTLEKDKNSAAVSMSQASQVGAVQHTAWP